MEKALNKHFSPEFLNRLDAIIHFDQLTIDDIKHIVDIELKPVIGRIKDMGINIHIDDKAKTFLASKGYDSRYGARPLKRTIQTYLENEICELILNSQIKQGIDLNITSGNEDKLLFTSCKNEKI